MTKIVGFKNMTPEQKILVKSALNALMNWMVLITIRLVMGYAIGRQFGFAIGFTAYYVIGTLDSINARLRTK
jgi:hypothetical protein